MFDIGTIHCRLLCELELNKSELVRMQTNSRTASQDYMVKVLHLRSLK
jgi:hypothetical protein